MKSYEHTQRGMLIIAFVLSLTAVFVAFAVLKSQPLVFVPATVMLISIWLFHSLTIRIANGELRWHFGGGLIHKRVSVADIASAKVVRTNFIEGWGIHLSRFGWLYNISGYGAVAITLNNGKRFALGSDEPEQLAEQILLASKS